VAGLVAYAALYGATRISSIGSLGGTLACTVGTFVVHGATSPIPWAGVFIGALIFWRHRENIRRLVKGEEKRLK
jgi:glycerol-3-phosphate acyltransferase PlsY